MSVLNKQKRFKVHPDSVWLFCAAILREVDAPPCSLTVAFVAARAIRKLNREYRGKDYATDVLTFGYDCSIIEGLPFWGEVVIAPEIARKHAHRWNTLPETEVRRLLVHGILHLMGYDHEVDDGEMFRTQARLTRRRFFRCRDPITGMQGI